MLSEEQFEKLEALKRELEKAEGKAEAPAQEGREELRLTEAQFELLSDLRNSPYLRPGLGQFKPL